MAESNVSPIDTAGSEPRLLARRVSLRVHSAPMEARIWANSGDSHLVEPPGLWNDLPARLFEQVYASFQHDRSAVGVPDPPTA